MLYSTNSVNIFFQLCEDLEKITELNNVNHTDFIENYLDLDIPVIVTDAMEDWPAREKFNIPFMYQVSSKQNNVCKINKITKKRSVIHEFCLPAKLKLIVTY